MGSNFFKNREIQLSQINFKDTHVLKDYLIIEEDNVIKIFMHSIY